METCMTCGMPFTGENQGEIALQTAEGAVCKFDVENGEVKSPAAIFEGGVQYFAQAATDGDRELAERITRTNMKSLPYWQSHPFELLNGPEASEEEFGAAMEKIASE